MRPVGAAVALLAMVLGVGTASAASLDTLDSAQDWRLRALRFEGNDAVGRDDLLAVMTTKPRRWFALWRPFPPFDPVSFRTDLDRVRALYRSRGYYHAQVGEEIEVTDDDAVAATVRITEGEAVHVTSVDVVAADGGEIPPEATAKLTIAPGAVFTESTYQEGERAIRAWYREGGFARVVVQRSARVDVRDDTAALTYTVDRGPSAVFGETTVEGLTEVDADVVRREIAYAPGEPFRESLVATTRSRIEALRLFRTVRLEEGGTRDPVVPIVVHVEEAPKHEIRLGIGYETEDGIRGLIGWRDYDFFGGGRQLGFSARASQLRRSLLGDFLQPHFPTSRSRLRLLFAQEEVDEDTYTLLQTRGVPRLEWDVTSHVAAFAFYRAELDLLSDVPTPVHRALPGGAPSTAVISGMGFGVDWNATDDLLDPTRGWIANLSVEPVGDRFGGDVSFLRVIGEGRLYQPLPAGLVSAFRLRLGTTELSGDTSVLPLYERFYAGGVNSVRGYARRRVGPLADDEPFGGQSLIETSAELRRAITPSFGGAIFVDAGQVALPSLDFPFGDLQYGTGFGVRYKSPVGPIRVDLGFPLDPRGDDALWQVYLSVGQTF